MTRQRIIVLLIITALATVGYLVGRNITWKEVTVPLPPRGEAATNSFYAAQRLAEQLGARTERRRTLGELPPTDAVILLSDWNWSVIEQRRLKLQSWVENGGRLIIDDTLIGGEEELEDWSGLALHDADEEEEKEEETEKAGEDELQGADPDEDAVAKALERLRQGTGDCADVTAALPLPATRNIYALCKPIYQDTWLTSEKSPAWALVDENHIQVARVGIGRGSITMLAAEPFGNRPLFQGDHALLFTAITQLRAGDMIYFVSEGSGTSLQVLMWRHGAPVVCLGALLLALWLWRGALRFGPRILVTQTAQRSLAEQIRGTGRFLVRIGSAKALHAAAARALHEAASRHIAHYARLQGEERTNAIAHATQIDASTLARVLDPETTRGKAELRTAVSLLETARRKLISGAR